MNFNEQGKVLSNSDSVLEILGFHSSVYQFHNCFKHLIVALIHLTLNRDKLRLVARQMLLCRAHVVPLVMPLV